VKKHRIVVATGVLALILASSLALGRRRDNHLSSEFEKVSIGMSHEEVADLMGSARREESCDSGMFASHDKRCAATDVYPLSFAPLDPEYMVIYFDSDHRVIDKIVYQSP
jgi:hypothetical protein